MATAFGDATFTFETDPGPVINFEMNDKVQINGRGKGNNTTTGEYREYEQDSQNSFGWLVDWPERYRNGCCCFSDEF